jgi:hypothetical protein
MKTRGHYPRPRSRWIGLALAFLFVLTPASLALAQQVGVAVRVINEASWKRFGGQPKPLFEYEGIDLGWILLTGKNSALVMTFRPRGFLHLGSRTQVTVDRAKMEKATDCDSPKVQVLNGDLRIVHGARQNYEVRCASVQFGSNHLEGYGNGTDIRLWVDPDFATYVAVAEGTAVIQPLFGGEPITLEAGDWRLIGPRGVLQAPEPSDKRSEIPENAPLLDCCDFRIDPPEFPFP